MQATRRNRCRGAALVYMAVAMFLLLGVVSLAVDVGRVQVVKAELRHAADAAARHAAQGLAQAGTTTARTNAIDCADDNYADGTRVVLDPVQDVEFGKWDASARTFTPVADPSDPQVEAVRVTARRTRARGNAVRLSFAPVVGVSTYDVTASAVAKANSRRPGIVGLDWINMGGSTTGGVGNVTNSYRSKNGAFTTTSYTYGRGTILSNGNITLSGGSTIYGDAHPGPGCTVSTGGGSTVTGSTSALAKALDYPMESAGSYATSNDNWRLPGWAYDGDGRNFVPGSASLTISGGTYYINNFQMGPSTGLTISGPATFYVTGNVRIDGAVYTSGNVPSNLRIVMLTAGSTVTLGSNGILYADVYAPGSAFTMGGSSTLCGSVVAKTVSLGGSASVIFDESLTVTAPGVSLVR